MVDQFIKAGITRGTVNENGVRVTNTDKFFQPFLKTFSVDEFSRAAADGADAYDTVIGNPVPAVAPCFGRTPPDVVDDGDPVSAKPVAERPHPKGVIYLDRFREVLIG